MDFNDKEFHRLYLNTLPPLDERKENLREKYVQYYKDTECCSNTLAMQYKKDLKHWCNINYYTPKEIKAVKRDVQRYRP